MTAHRYQLVAPLARGGMGEILLARRLGPAGFEKLVVLKRPLHTGGSRALVTALIDEARLLAQIHHPNVCEVYDLEQAGDQFFFTMEYLEGLSMWSMLGEVPGGIDPRISCGLFEQACEGLEAIHAMRTTDGGCIVHRDVSPGNLFVTERGVVKVLDLGIAKSTGSEERTPFGQVKGKLGYLSPEQAASKPVDHRSDLFSLGLVLYDMVSGQRPARDRIGVIAAAALDLTGVAQPLADVIRRAIAGDADDRFGSAGEMAAALRGAGAALGGSFGTREIAAWLAQQFGPELARRRAIATSPTEATRTQIWVLRSASDAPDDDDVPAEPPAPPVHDTEHLVVPTRERLSSSPGERRTSVAGELMRPPTGSARSGRSPGQRRSAAIAGAAIAIAIGVVAALLVKDGSAGAVAQPAGATPPALTPPPAPPVAPVAATPGSSTDAPAEDLAPPGARTASATSASPPGASAPRPRPRRPAEPAATGLLTIDSQPFAEIRLGNRSLGTTPLWRVSVPAGRHAFRATTADGRVQDIEFRITPGHERKVMLDWSRP